MKHSVLAVLALGLFCMCTVPCVSAGEPVIKDGANPIVLMKTTAGDIEIELFEDAAPNTVGNFVQLIEKKFYDGLTFHRIIKDFMIQGGCPKGTGTGDAGYKFADEFANNPNKNLQYAISMANAGPNTNGSQFFIITKKGGTSWLDGRHTVFGKVTKGTDVVDTLGVSPTGPGDRPTPAVKIVTVTVVQKQKHEYAVKKD